MQSRKEKEIDVINWLDTLFLHVLATLRLYKKILHL